jgi:hypothetical protein
LAGQFAIAAQKYALDYTSGRSATLSTRTTYLVLLNSAPTDATTLASMNEVTTAGYVRQAVTWSVPTNASPSVTSNTATITFGPFTVAMGIAPSYMALVSALSGTSGDFLWWWAIDNPVLPTVNESLQILTGQLTMDLT